MIKALLMMVIATLFNSTAQVLYKYAINEGGLHIALLLKQGVIIIGLAAYAISGVLMILSLREGEASKLYPIYTLSFVWITIGSAVWFAEQLTLPSLAGISLIITGIITINSGGTP